MQREEPEYAGEQQIHENRCQVKHGVRLAVVSVRVGAVLHEAGVGARMALAAGLDQVCRCDS